MRKMDIIIYDLETTYSYKKGQIPEIVEIGAVRIDPKIRQITDSFQCYVFPQIRGKFDSRTMRFIGMKEEDQFNAISFPEALEQLKSWMGDDYYFCAWGPDDKRIFIEHCVRFAFSFDWLKNTNNIQTPISLLLGPVKQMGLAKAMEIAGLDPEGRLHSALDDSVNTAKLFLHCYDQVPLEINDPPTFEGESCPLYRTCRGCKKEKWYRQFRSRKNFCIRCESRWKAKHFASQSPV
ncbi:exonuclease domain-containing protein [Brevibacillus ginsengisoli]